MRRTWIVLGLLVTAACSASAPSGAAPTAPEPPLSLVTVPAVAEPTGFVPATVPATGAPPVITGAASHVVVDDAGNVAVVDPRGVTTRVRDDWSRRTLSIDGTYVVSTVMVGAGDTKVAWDSVPSMEVVGGTVLEGEELEVATTQADGRIAALVDPASPALAGAIAGGRSSTTVVIASPREGEVARFELDGNVVPEAFGSTPGPGGLPAQIFMLEYLPAEAPTRYRVRVLDTATGAMSLPVNLRDKLGPRVDQEMAGVSRDQVLARDGGLLFTLYRGTDQMPDGHPYAFVHTLDLFDGVWCLDVPAEMELEHVPGALATYGDLLYVASANGTVGAYSIADLVEPSGPVTMRWVSRVVAGGDDEAPSIAAGPDGVVVTWPWMSGFHSVSPDGTVGPSTIGPAGTQAIALADGTLSVVGDAWWNLPGERPDWLDTATRLLVAA